MANKQSKLTLKLDTIRVLSSLEMSLVIGGLALSPAQPQGLNTLSIHCSSACNTKVVTVKPVTTAAVLR